MNSEAGSEPMSIDDLWYAVAEAALGLPTDLDPEAEDEHERLTSGFEFTRARSGRGDVDRLLMSPRVFAKVLTWASRDPEAARQLAEAIGQ